MARKKDPGPEYKEDKIRLGGRLALASGGTPLADEAAQKRLLQGRNRESHRPSECPGSESGGHHTEWKEKGSEVSFQEAPINPCEEGWSRLVLRPRAATTNPAPCPAFPPLCHSYYSPSVCKCSFLE